MTKQSVVVIGAGLAGSLLCNELVNHTDVTLLEIGDQNRIRYPAIGFDHKALGHVNTFCFGGGGTTNLWHNGLIPIQPGDVLDDDFRDVLADAQPFMNDAARRLFFSGSFSHAYDEAVAEARAIAESLGLADDGVDCLLYPKQFSPLTVDARVDGCYGVDRIRFDYARGRINAVRFRAGSTERVVETAAVIVAAGAMGSPRILRDVITACAQRVETLGSGFIDHPLGFVGKVRFEKKADEAIKRFSMINRADFTVGSAIRLKSDCGRYTCCAFLRPAVTLHNNLSIYKFKSLLGATAGAARIRNALSWRLLHLDIIAEVLAHLLGVNIPSRTYNVLFVAEQKPGRNRVYYERDGLRVDWSISEEELTVYRSLLRRLSSRLERVAEHVNLRTDLTDEWLWSGAHHSNTTPLGSTATDLVDRNLRLKFCDNVHVCDGSVIQEHSYANTGLTIGQLALRLARRVLSLH
jgi:choline dehydrogenase-like flavoprotein